MALKTLTTTEFDLMLNYGVEVATAQVTEIVFPQKSAITNSKYFLLNSTTTSYYVWFDVTGAAVNPAVAGKTGIKVDISAGTIATSYDVAAAVSAVLDAHAAFASVVLGADRIRVTNAVAGVVGAASDFNAGVFVFNIVVGHGAEARYIFPQSSTGLSTSDNHFAYVKNILGGGLKFKALDSEYLEDAIPTNPKILGFMLIADSSVYETNVLALALAQKIV